MYFGVLWQSCTALLQLAPLPYAYNALEPHLDEATMQLHHLRHLQGYVDRTNAILQSMRESGIASAHRIAKLGLDYALLHLDEVQDEGQRRALRNVGGGVINHELFFSSLSPPPPVGHGGVILQDLEVVTAIEAAFGSMESFKERMRSAALAVFGSGWAFLEVDGRGSGAPTLNITMAANQDSPAMEAGRHPLLGLDVWEHAYCE